jgi:hypothetical protein
MIMYSDYVTARLGMVVQSIISATWVTEIEGSWFKASPGQKLARPYVKK